MNEPEPKIPDSNLPSDADPEAQMRRISRRSFLWAGGAVAGAYAAFHYLNASKDEDGLVSPLREGLYFNEKVALALYSPKRLTPTFTDKDITPQKINETIGMEDDLNLDDYELDVDGTTVGKQIALSMEDIKKLPKIEYVAEFKCVEGWSAFTKWGGARFADFHAKYPSQPGTNYVYLETPNGGYQVTNDLPSMLHPQTLLCYEMNGQPLTDEHGAPLRLIIPHKYGYKNIKRIGYIAYSPKRMDDYWADQGYDFYAGL